MERTFVDVLTEEMKDAMLSIKSETRDMFKNKIPYRQIKQTDVDRITQYMMLSPDVKQQLFNDFGQDYIDYEDRMEKLVREYGNE